MVKTPHSGCAKRHDLGSVTPPQVRANHVVGFGPTQQPAGTKAVIVVEVVPGSPAAQVGHEAAMAAGVVRGQKLVGISDPVRDSETQLVLQDYLNLTDPAWAVGSASTDSAGSAAPSNPQGGGEVTQRARSESPSFSPEDSMDDGSSLPRAARLDGLMSDSEDAGGLTIGEAMAARYARQTQAAKQVNAVQQRIARRKAYMEQEAQRDDSGLLLSLLAAFLGPALIILAVASSTGYLDRLYANTLTLQ
ncbi:hypothetical protein QJQ45_023819 [Haematococcus lacustris]|nr:hypothetical protein QJQ45_023819 [Haematococcus lacustris]